VRPLTQSAPLVDDVRRVALAVSRPVCLLTGGLLLLDTIPALVFTAFDLATGDDLPSQGWNFVFAFNTWHHLLHVVTSTGLLIAGMRREWAPVGLLMFGAIYVLLAPAGFIDGDDAFDVIYSGWRENWVHAVLAVQGVVLGVLGLQARARERGQPAALTK